MTLPIRKRTICADGVSLSIQADEYKYCWPRDDEGPWLQVEVGFITDAADNPMTPPETWKDHADGDFPSDVYGYVPVMLVQKFIDDHGGIKDGPGIP